MNSPRGFFIFEDHEEPRNWKEQEIQISRELSNIVRLKSDVLDSGEKVEYSEQKFRLISEASRDLVCTHNLDGVFKYVSPSSRDILGYEPEELIGTSPYDLFHPEDIKKIASGSHENVLRGNNGSKIEYSIQTKK